MTKPPHSRKVLISSKGEAILRRDRPEHLNGRAFWFTSFITGTIKQGLLRGVRIGVAAVWLAATVAILGFLSSSGPARAWETGGGITVKVLYKNGERVSWSKARGRLAFDARGGDGFFDVFTMTPDGADVRPLTAGRGNGPGRHKGQPAWRPSGRFLALQIENPKLEDYKDKAGSALGRYLESPGVGVNNNIWIMNPDSGEFWRVTNVKSKLAVLHPHFSPDGAKLVWAEAVRRRRLKGLEWAIRLADFSIASDGSPVVGNVRSLRPGNQALYETHGFSPDGRKLIYSAAPGARDYFGFEIYTYDLETGRVEQLTNDRHWDEHAHFSPDGRRIVWMSSREIRQSGKLQDLKTDFWIMNADGSDKRRLTRFNDTRAPEYVQGGVICGDNDWRDQGRSVFAFIILKKYSRPRAGERRTRIVRIDF